LSGRFGLGFRESAGRRGEGTSMDIGYVRTKLSELADQGGVPTIAIDADASDQPNRQRVRYGSPLLVSVKNSLLNVSYLIYPKDQVGI
jgi:hypothetical protein